MKGNRVLIETANLVKYQLARKEGHKTARTFKIAVSYLMHKDNIGRQNQIEIWGKEKQEFNGMA